MRDTASHAWRVGNERLYDHYRQGAPEYPDTIEEMLPLYAAVVHGCRAGKEQEAWDGVYDRRILRGDKFFSARKLGAFGAELTALAAFFEALWERPFSGLTEADRASLLSSAGSYLSALGRLPEAVQPMRAGLDAWIAEENRRVAAISAGNLSELTLTLGEVAGAIETARESVDLADQSGDEFWKMATRTTLAHALYDEGRWEETEALFREAQEIAERGSMRLFEADAHLEWTRLHLDLGDRDTARLPSPLHAGPGAADRAEPPVPARAGDRRRSKPLPPSLAAEPPRLDSSTPLRSSRDDNEKTYRRSSTRSTSSQGT